MNTRNRFLRKALTWSVIGIYLSWALVWGLTIYGWLRCIAPKVFRDRERRLYLRDSFQRIAKELDGLTAEIRSSAPVPKEIMARVVARNEELKVERAKLDRMCTVLTVDSTWNSIVDWTLESCGARLQTMCDRAQKLKEILKRHDSDTYVSELVVWIFWPSGNGETLLGDLFEEHASQLAEKGAAAAKAWLDRQVWQSVSALIRDKARRVWYGLEFILTLTALFELVTRLIKK